MAETSYGWAGWIARVNLTSGDITEESDVEMQKDYIGGMGFANKIMYDEVGPEVDWMDEENKAVVVNAERSERLVDFVDARLHFGVARLHPRGVQRRHRDPHEDHNDAHYHQ